MIIVKSISHEQRQAASIARRQARQQGRKILDRITPGQQAAHVLSASTYFALPTKGNAKALGIADHVVFRTSAYMHKQAGAERVLHVCHRNFLTDTLEEQQTEMTALIARSPGRGDAFEHMVLSVRNEVDLTPELMTHLPARLLEVLGAADHQAFVVWHGDTDHNHCHIGVNRVHPATLKRLQLGDGWLIDTIAQAVAMIEYEQGWSHEQGAHYVADERGVRAKITNERVRDAAGNPTGEHLDHAAQRESDARGPKLKLSNSAREHEERQGSWSDERTAKLIATPIIRKAQGWAELHRRLAAEGIRYEKERSGARIYIGHRSMPATTAHWSASIAKLERLGTFVPRADDIQVVAFTPRRFDDADRQMAYADLKTRRKTAAARDSRIADKTTTEAITALAGNHARLQQLIDDVDWTGRGAELNIARQLASVARRDAQTLLEANARALKADATHRHRMPPLKRWLGGLAIDNGEEADDDEIGGVVGILVGANGHHVAPTIELSGYDIEDDVWERRYSRDGDVKFVDRGNIILVIALREREEVRAALKLAQRKWGTVQVTGDERFLLLVADLAAEEGVTLANAELEKRIAWRTRALKREADHRERASVIDQRIRTMLDQWPFVLPQNKTYAVAPAMLERYGLTAEDVAAAAVQKLLAEQYEKQKPALDRLSADIQRDPARFMTAADMRTWNAPEAPFNVGQSWVLDEHLVRRVRSLAEKAEQERGRQANASRAALVAASKEPALPVNSAESDRQARHAAAHLRAAHMVASDKHLRLDDQQRDQSGREIAGWEVLERDAHSR